MVSVEDWRFLTGAGFCRGIASTNREQERVDNDATRQIFRDEKSILLTSSSKRKAGLQVWSGERSQRSLANTDTKETTGLIYSLPDMTEASTT